MYHFIYSIVLVIKESSCPSDQIKLESSCYYFSKNETTWHEARRIRQQKGGDLAVPKNNAENKAIFKFLKRNCLNKPFIGLFRNESDEEFYTVQNIKPKFVNWQPLQPDNFRGVEDCAHYWQNTDKWNDVSCNNYYSFICQGEQSKIKCKY